MSRRAHKSLISILTSQSWVCRVTYEQWSNLFQIRLCILHIQLFYLFGLGNILSCFYVLWGVGLFVWCLWINFHTVLLNTLNWCIKCMSLSLFIVKLKKNWFCNKINNFFTLSIIDLLIIFVLFYFYYSVLKFE